uniref:Legume lectin beta domain protein n=1 Tax=Rhizophora mucronata TaxID=61149 RepID=A0A2P2JKV4_RHIMU
MIHLLTACQHIEENWFSCQITEQKQTMASFMHDNLNLVEKPIEAELNYSAHSQGWLNLQHLIS